MALKFFQKSATIPFADGEGEISVRGLSLPEITQIVDTHRDDAILLFDRFTGRDADSITLDDASTIAGDLLVKFPCIVAHVVAIAADAIDQFDDVKRLPPDVTVAALEQAALLTFAMSGGFNTFLEMIVRIATRANDLGSDLRDRRPSISGSEDSEASKAS